MPLHVIQVALYSIASFMVGGAIAWRVLGRAHGGYSRKLAQELTDSVHARCSAYRSLEGRIDAVVAEFDRCEAELRGEMPEGAQAPEASSFEEIAETAEPEEQAAGGAEALEWMDACVAPGEELLPVAGEAAFVGLPVPEPAVVEETGSVVDQFAQKLQILQREKTDELQRQRGRVDGLEGRMLSLEASIQELLELSRRGHAPAPARTEGAPSWQRELDELFERLARSEGALAAWHAQHEVWSRERVALIESAREFAARMGEGAHRNPEAEAAVTSLRARAEELARDAAKLQSSITRREAPAPRNAPEAAAKAAPKAASAPAARPVQAEPAPQPQPVEAAVLPSQDPVPTPDVDSVPSMIESAGGLESAPVEGTQVGQLMRNLEIAKSDAEKYRRKLHEQGLQFTAAYAMLDRIRPFVQALENEFAAQARGGEKKS